MTLMLVVACVLCAALLIHQDSSKRADSCKPTPRDLVILIVFAVFVLYGFPPHALSLRCLPAALLPLVRATGDLSCFRRKNPMAVAMEDLPELSTSTRTIQYWAPIAQIFSRNSEVHSPGTAMPLNGIRTRRTHQNDCHVLLHAAVHTKLHAVQPNSSTVPKRYAQTVCHEIKPNYLTHALLSDT